MSSLRRITLTHRLRRTHAWLEADLEVELEPERADCPLKPIETAPDPLRSLSRGGGGSADH